MMMSIYDDEVEKMKKVEGSETGWCEEEVGSSLFSYKIR